MKGLPFVINLTLPDDASQYYHRIGRVGRAGHMGLAVSIVAIDEKEKVWYHANCGKKRGVGCKNTRLVKQGGCCIFYDEPKLLKAVESKLGEAVSRVADDLSLPSGMKLKDYGRKLDEKEQQVSARVESLRPAVEELCGMEVDLQSMWLHTRLRWESKPDS